MQTQRPNILRGGLAAFCAACLYLPTACGSSDTAETATRGGTSATGGAASNTAVCDPVAFAMLSSAQSQAKLCAAIPACVDAQCQEAAVNCAGANYKGGNFSGGTCANYYACVDACNCDKACADQCSPDSLDCASCISIDMGMGCTLKCVSEIASCGAAPT